MGDGTASTPEKSYTGNSNEVHRAVDLAGAWNAFSLSCLSCVVLCCVTSYHLVAVRLRSETKTREDRCFCDKLSGMRAM